VTLALTVERRPEVQYIPQGTMTSVEHSMVPSGRIHWGRILAAGFLAEVAIFIVVIPILARYGARAEQYATPPTALAATFLATLWAARRIKSRLVLHGLLVGVVGTLLYVALTLAQPEPGLFVLAHGLKLVGGTAAGFVVEQRRKTAVTPEVGAARA
jgi:putative membrane protein (TIGR04086 family)